MACLCFCFACLWLLLGLFLYSGGTSSYSFGTTSTGSLPQLASLAVICTASKHLHNDLAKAIEALEPKKLV